jgi:predicted kinase
MALTLMCGLSFSGKSTLAAQLAAELDAEVISLDAINLERGLDSGQGITLEEWAETNRIAEDRVQDLLRADRQVVVDDTGSPRFIRDGWRDVAEAAGRGFVLVWVQIDEPLLRERLQANRAAQSRHDVTDEVLAAHLTEFEPPVDEHAITINASDTRDAQRIHEIAQSISGTPSGNNVR